MKSKIAANISQINISDIRFANVVIFFYELDKPVLQIELNHLKHFSAGVSTDLQDT